MKPRFEEHEGQLFRMLEEPVPLTQDSEMPCLCGYIKDKSLAGEYNRRMRNASKIIDRKVIITEIRSSAAYDHELRFGFAKSSCEARYEQLEIIGYPVADGSAEWALWAMMEENKVINSNSTVPFTLTDDRIVRIDDSVSWDVGHWLRIFDDTTGWQIYTEPEHPKYRVGDWVEYRLDGDTYYGKICNIRGYVHYFSVTTEEIPKDQARAIMLESVIRKLSPSEVVIHIGCLSGTVAEHFPGSDWAFRMIHGDDKESYISFHALDTRTRELVKSLLKAMRGEK